MRKPHWDARCSAILQRLAGQHHDHEIAALIEAETGKRFMPRTVAGYRRADDLPACRRNDWTAPLKLWRAGGMTIRLAGGKDREEARIEARVAAAPPGVTRKDAP
jgi:hypothetical protein